MCNYRQNKWKVLFIPIIDRGEGLELYFSCLLRDGNGAAPARTALFMPKYCAHKRGDKNEKNSCIFTNNPSRIYYICI